MSDSLILILKHLCTGGVGGGDGGGGEMEEEQKWGENLILRFNFDTWFAVLLIFQKTGDVKLTLRRYIV